MAVKEYDLTNVNEVIAVMVASGVSDAEICTAHNLSNSAIQTLKRSPLFMLRVKQLRDELLQDGTVLQMRMHRVAEKSLDCIEKLVDLPIAGDIQLLKLQASNAQMILSKAGFGDTSNVNISSQNKSISAMLTPEEMDELRKRA